MSEDRLNALRQVLEEKLVERKVSLKALDYGKVEEASGGTARKHVNLVAGISPTRPPRSTSSSRASASRACRARCRASSCG